MVISKQYKFRVGVGHDHRSNFTNSWQKNFSNNLNYFYNINMTRADQMDENS